MRGKLDLVFHLARAGCDPGQILMKLGLRAALRGCQSVLDVGSGVALTMRQLGVEHTVGAAVEMICDCGHFGCGRAALDI